MDEQDKINHNADAQQDPQVLPPPQEGEESLTGSFWDKKRVRRLVVAILAAIIDLTFLALSYSYFTLIPLAGIAFTLFAIIALAFVALVKDWETTYKISITVLYVAAVLLIPYFALQKSGLLSSVHSAEDFVAYINNSGGVAEVLFVLANFLQVTVIPIPSTITTTAGAILFDGIWKPLYLTVIGLVAGSMLAFFLGRVLGVRFANWLVGENAIKKYKEMTKGRDKIVLFYMFIFPFFPDDFLCILAGMTDYTYLGFFFLQIFCRTVGTLTTILIAKGIVSIPFYGWWLLLWAFIIALVIVLLILTIKYSDKIEEFFMKVIDKITFGFTERLRNKKQAEAQGAQATERSAADTLQSNGEIPSGPTVQGDNNDDVTQKH